MGYAFKNDKFLDGSKTIATIKRDKICEGYGSSTICNIRDDKVREKNGSTTVCNVKNGDIRKTNGSSRMEYIKNVRKQIKNSEAVSDAFLAGFWYYFIR
tara:strand:- start:89 stop:385 length:297 start_codon:yes stop_codon:yes gene_type:complete